MVLLINIIAALILFWIPVRKFQKRDDIVASHPFEKGSYISVNFELYFLVYSILTAMVFLGPLSLVKYGFWIIFLVILAFSHLEIKLGAIVWAYLLFLGWNVISAALISTEKFQALMNLIKYALPLFYLWLGYTAIKDSDDLLFFIKKVSIGMCVYALIIGGFSAKFLGPLYNFLNFTSGGLFISYASLADYFSGLIVVPLALYIITKNNKWLYATLWVVLSTVLESVRTGLGGIFLASSFFLVTIFRAKAIPWIAGIAVAAVIVVFSVPSLREKMFWDEDKTISALSMEDTNMDNIRDNGRKYLWELNMSRFYEPHKLTGAGLGESAAWMKNRPGLKMLHSDYVQMLCEIGLIGVVLFGAFVLITLVTIISTVWRPEIPDVLKITGGMALGSCAGTFFSMSFDNVVAYAQQSFVIPFVMIGIYMKVKDLYEADKWDVMID